MGKDSQSCHSFGILTRYTQLCCVIGKSTPTFPASLHLPSILLFQVWLLPVRCVRQGCESVMSAKQQMESPQTINSQIRQITCSECTMTFSHQLQYVRGDPRNIAYIGMARIEILELLVLTSYNCRTLGWFSTFWKHQSLLW